jgi:hypothetical protein
MAAPVPPHGFLPQVVNPGVGGGGGAPPLVDAPQLPFGADPGSITGWMLQATMTDTPSTISLQTERSFARLNHHDYAAARQGIIDEILNSNTLETYLIVSNQFGGTNALHGKDYGHARGDSWRTTTSSDPVPRRRCGSRLRIRADVGER